MNCSKDSVTKGNLYIRFFFFSRIVWSFLTRWNVQFICKCHEWRWYKRVVVSVAEEVRRTSSIVFVLYFLRQRCVSHFNLDDIVIIEIEIVINKNIFTDIYIQEKKKREARKCTTETCVHVNKRDEKSFRPSASERHPIQSKICGFDTNSSMVNVSRTAVRGTDPL